MRSSLIKAAVVVAAAAAATGVLAGPALADPPAQHPVLATDITGTGSDTIQYALNDLAAGYNTANNINITTGAGYVTSWDAVNPQTGAIGENITVKPGDTLPRPNGSGAGIKALHDHAYLDYARSSRGPQAGDVDADGNPLLFLPFAEDQLNYAVATTTNAPLNLNISQLKSIYLCQVTTWNQVGGTSGDTIIPEIPQINSGTRAFFEQTLGVTDAQILAAPCVHTIEENTPSDIAGNPDNIAPFSYAQFESRYQNSGIKLSTNGLANREVYDVVRSDPNTLVPTYLQRMFGDGTGAVDSTHNYVCSAAGQAIAHADGFKSLNTTDFPDAACGLAEVYIP
ncbi:MAG TPA: substrate-binding domain-containing protein [Pseudonocardiaceae bacterium]